MNYNNYVIKNYLHNPVFESVTDVIHSFVLQFSLQGHK